MRVAFNLVLSNFVVLVWIIGTTVAPGFSWIIDQAFRTVQAAQNRQSFRHIFVPESAVHYGCELRLDQCLSKDLH